jgi:curli biogenesis system outer membrane secretion channel CsgG
VNKARIALEVRIVDSATSHVLSSKKLQGQASESADEPNPMERAIKLCVIEAVRFVAQAVPAEYYKY